MAVLVPIIGIPSALAAAYYSWKVSFTLASSAIDNGNEQRSTKGALFGAASVFAATTAGVIYNSRHAPQQNTDRSVPRPTFTTKHFLRGSRKLIVQGTIVWCLSAVAAGLGSVAFAPQSIQEVPSVKYP